MVFRLLSSKKNWDVVGQNVINAVLEFFKYGKLLKEVNHTSIGLIPKSNEAQYVNDFRPISYCNVTFKIITKILANSMAPILPKIIDQAQGPFVEGRNISDNIFLAQELIRGYGRQRSALKCMIMVDLRKAYDTVNWDFLHEVLCGFNFPNQFIKWIMECVTTATFSIFVNGMLFGFFHGKRGLRQGDPMSPMLFSICLEYFSRMLNFTARNSAFSYHPMCKKLGITHLAYADDNCSVSIILGTLADFENTYGLTVNTQKSHIFTVGVHNDRLDFFGLPKGALPIRYLGVPLDAQLLQIYQFTPLFQSISWLIECWKGHSLSYAGRLQLLRAVVQGVIGFWVQHFPIPEGVFSHLNSLCSNFL